MNEQIQSLIIKYITGEADQEQREWVRRWIGQSQENMDYYIQLKSTWDDALHYPGQPAVDTDKAFERLRGRLQAPERGGATISAGGGSATSGSGAGAGGGEGLTPKHGSGEGSDRGRRRVVTPLRAAAAVIIILAAGGAGMLFSKKPKPVVAAAFDMFVGNGKKKRLVLPDSTEVWLNAGTHFSYSAGFGRTDREVDLEGEGYFVVHHDAKLPFVVKARGYRVRDVGTIFTVSAYPGSSWVTAVLEGKVEVSADADSARRLKTVILTRNEVLKIRQAADSQAVPGKGSRYTPGRQAVGGDEGTPQVTATEHMEKYEAWRDNTLVFEGESFDDVARRLERTFNVKINIKSGELSRLMYTGRFTRVQSIEEAMKIIRETTPIAYEIKKDTVTIRQLKQ
ncbi:MAG: FecR family protein [Bacteroidetes bacterium]|nr:FecR family protein [Bacteroidota bacterium]